MSLNNLTEEIPTSICNLKSLEMLDFSRNNLCGEIPQCLGNISALNFLDMHHNNLSGNIPTTFSNESSLTNLNLHSNKLEGKLPRSLANCKELQVLDLGDNHLIDTFPMWLGTLSNLKVLSLRSNELHGPIRTSRIENMFPELRIIDLSYNAFSGNLPSSLFQHLKAMRTIDPSMEATRYHGDAYYQGSVVTVSMGFEREIARILYLYTVIDLSSNKFGGQIPSSICNLTSLVMLDLARNNLTGEIPQCLGNITALQVLDMHHNNLSGNIPTTFRNGSSLSSLNLHGNKLEGIIPQSLTNCKQLEVLDLGDNHLNDTFPVWLGTLPKLKVLSLRSNKLHGSIRTLTTQNLFPQLKILDLSSNAFTKNLPKSLFQHLKAMTTTDQTMNAPSHEGEGYYEDSVVVVSKGLELEVVRILFLYIAVDLSNNKFEGHIPSIMGDLIALRVLNISHNELEGHIPSSLGSLSLVESLDLSSNHLVGKIPAEFASQGCIPQGNQLQTFESNSYEGNDGLRGFPVSKGCGNDHDAISEQLDDDESNSEFWSDFRKAALMGYGSGICIGLSIIYFMMSSGKPIWLARIIVQLEHKIMMGRRKKQRRKRNYRRRNNH